MTAKDAHWKSRRVCLVLKNVDILGAKCSEEEQENVASILLSPLRIHRLWHKSAPSRILRNVDILLRPGEILLVLGRPGSGSSSLLKAIGGNLGGLTLAKNSVLHYNGKSSKTLANLNRAHRWVGIPQREMLQNFKGEVVYNAESDIHFPHLTTKQTLEFAAALRMPRNRIVGISREEHIQQMTAVAMAMCGLTHVQGTKVGNDYVRGVSGGERKVKLGILLLNQSLTYL
jgi:ABC-type multidrug transport system ATPase subunit